MCKRRRRKILSSKHRDAKLMLGSNRENAHTRMIAGSVSASSSCSVQRAAIKRAVAIGNRSTAKYLKISGLRLIDPQYHTIHR